MANLAFNLKPQVIAPSILITVLWFKTINKSISLLDFIVKFSMGLIIKIEPRREVQITILKQQIPLLQGQFCDALPK